MTAAGDAIGTLALSTNARRVLEAHYLRRDASGGVVEPPAEMLARVFIEAKTDQ
jgi:hypothetical protein